VTHSQRRPDFVKTLVAWGNAWHPASHEVRITSGPTDSPNAAAWVAADGHATAGQVTVWARGDCEVEVYDVTSTSPAPRLLEHFDVDTEDGLISILDRFAISLDEA
jgi:hypothetical protein